MARDGMNKHCAGEGNHFNQIHHQRTPPYWFQHSQSFVFLAFLLSKTPMAMWTIQTQHRLQCAILTKSGEDLCRQCRPLITICGRWQFTDDHSWSSHTLKNNCSGHRQSFFLYFIPVSFTEPIKQKESEAEFSFSSYTINTALIYFQSHS